MTRYTSWIALLACVALLAACGDEDETQPLDIEEGGNVENASTPNASTPNGEPNVEPNNVNVGENPAVETILETTATTGASGFSTEITFDVPENTQSLAVTVNGERGTTYTLAFWRNGPMGEFVVPQNWYTQSQVGPTLCLTCPNRVVSADSAFAAMLPVNPALEVTPGQHSIGVFSYQIEGFNLAPAASNFEVKVVAKVLPARPEVGVVDVNFFFTGAGGWTAASAADDPEFQQVLDTVNEVWGQVDVTLGELTYNDVDSSYAVIEEATVPGGDLTELFALSSNAPRDAVNVFFVEELMAGGGLGGFGVILGISGGIPGPIGYSSSDKNGVALIVDPPPEIPTPIGLVFAHEVGHYLGLSHTSENPLAGSTHDQLTDTPENDASYLMHNMGSGNKMSEQQGVVMRLNPWTRNEGGAQ